MPENQMDERLIFLFSLPRSGSTLLQKLLGAHESIRVVSEPWILLPLLYVRAPEGGTAIYKHDTAARAIQDFAANLRGGEADFHEEIRQFALGLYGRMAGDGEFFLDKTPRYYLIIDEILDLFPKAQVIFLFRNPLAIQASVMNTWCGGRFVSSPPMYMDLTEGPKLLAAGYKRARDRACRVQYEELVRAPEQVLPRVLDHLDLPYDETMLAAYRSTPLGGRMGDSQGVKDYAGIAPVAADKWRETYRSRFRKAAARRYLERVDEDTLNCFGFSRDQLLQEVAAVRSGYRLGLLDAMDYGWAGVKRSLNLEGLTAVLKPGIRRYLSRHPVIRRLVETFRRRPLGLRVDGVTPTSLGGGVSRGDGSRDRSGGPGRIPLDR